MQDDPGSRREVSPYPPPHWRVRYYESSEAHFAEWRPDPFPPKDLGSRIRGIRWERAAILLLVAGASLSVTLILRHAYFLFWIAPTFLVALVRRIWSRRTVPEVLHLLDLPATVPQFPVEVRFAANSHIYGRDEGVVSFVDGWLHFNGLHTDFSVTPWHVDPVPSTSRSGGMAFSKLSLFYTVDGAPFQTTLSPFDTVSGVDNPFQGQFLARADLWTEIREKKPEGNAILPPVRPMPATVSGYFRNRQLMFFGLSLCLGAFVVLAYLHFPSGPLGSLAFLLFVAMAGLILLLARTRPRMGTFQWLLDRPLSDEGPQGQPTASSGTDGISWSNSASTSEQPVNIIEPSQHQR